jgi:predicted RNA binding protein YcfA (HicA-like mRNA interferase family)
MTKALTFAELEKLLLELGFVRQSVQGTHQVFQYPALGTLVVLPGYKSQDWVHPAHLVSVRRVLAENGLMSTTEFDILTSSTKVSA